MLLRDGRRAQLPIRWIMAFLSRGTQPGVGAAGGVVLTFCRSIGRLKEKLNRDSKNVAGRIFPGTGFWLKDRQELPMGVEMIANVEALVNSAVTTVFDTMLGLPMKDTPVETCLFGDAPQIASAVGFAGAASGVIYLYTTVRFAGRITAGLLGLPEAEAQREDYVNDAMGEMANMVMGHVKSRLTDRGVKCVMTIPSIVRGSGLGIEAVSHTRVQRMGFRSDKDFVLVEVLIENSDGKGK